MIIIKKSNTTSDNFLLSVIADDAKSYKIFGFLIWKIPVYWVDPYKQLAKFIFKFGECIIFKKSNFNINNSSKQFVNSFKGVGYWCDKKNTYFIAYSENQLVTLMNTIWSWGFDDIFLPVSKSFLKDKNYKEYFNSSKIIFSATLDFELEIFTKSYSFQDLLNILNKVNSELDKK